MKQYVALLRGINLGKVRKVLMCDLRELFIDLKFRDVKTYIQSGNVIFSYEVSESTSSMEDRIERALLLTFGFEILVIIKTAEQFEKIVQSNPFLKDPAIDHKQLHITFLKRAPEKALVDDVDRSLYYPDLFEIINETLYINCIGEYRKTKLGNNLFEKKLKVGASTRNWRTTMKLYSLLDL